MKKKTIHLLTKSMLTKLALVVALFLGNVSLAVADGKTLPYSYGFEDSDIVNTGGWTMVDYNVGNTGRKTYPAGRTGNALFCFWNSTTPPQYLVSPELEVPNDASSVRVIFYYRANSAYNTETFCFGYSKTSDNVKGDGVFTWEEEVSTKNTSWQSYETVLSPDIKYIAFKYTANNQNRMFIDDVSVTSVGAGPALSVYDGASEITTGYSYDFKLSVPNTTKVFTLKNPGTSALTVNVGETGSFNATLSSNTIEANGDVNLTVTMPNATSSSVITITPAAESGIDPFVINVSGTIRDENKMYEQFSSKSLPAGWKASDSYAFSSGYANSGAISDAVLTTTKMNFAKDEILYFDAAGSKSWGASSLTVKYSVDGSSFTTLQTFNSIAYNTWDTYSVTIPSSEVKYIQFVGNYLYIDNVYGGEYPIEPLLAVNATDYSFGMITTETTTSNFTISNDGLAELTGLSVSSDNSNFVVTMSNESVKSLSAGAKTTFTVTLKADVIGAQSGTITISADGLDDITFAVSGFVADATKMMISFDDGMPKGWTSNNWSYSSKAAYVGSSSENSLVSPWLKVGNNEILYFQTRSDYNYPNIYLYYSTDDGENWTQVAYYKNNEIPENYVTFSVNSIPAGYVKLKFTGYYVYLDNINGFHTAVRLDETIESELAVDGLYDYADVVYTAKADSWNTIALPFAVDDLSVFGEGTNAYALSSFVDNALTFSKVTALEAGTPYLLRTKSAISEPLTFTNVTISASSPVIKNEASFVPVYAPMPAGSLTGKYGVTNAGGIAKAGAGASMKGYRAYLELPSGATARILVIDMEGETTDLGFVKMIDQEAKAVYNLSGQRVEKGRKGLYIVNGKKVVVK